MLEKVFFGVPKKMGYYVTFEDDDDIDSEPNSPVFKKRKMRLSQVDFEIMSTNSNSKADKPKAIKDDFFRSVRWFFLIA